MADFIHKDIKRLYVEPVLSVLGFPPLCVHMELPPMLRHLTIVLSLLVIRVLRRYISLSVSLFVHFCSSVPSGSLFVSSLQPCQLCRLVLCTTSTICLLSILIFAAILLMLFSFHSLEWLSCSLFFFSFPQTEEFMRISLVEGKAVLGAFDENLRAYALRRIRSHANLELVQDNVVSVHADRVMLASGRDIPCGLKVWTAGIQTPPVLQKLDLQKSPSGHLLVDKHLRVMGHTNIFALGDCTLVESSPLPATAQVCSLVPFHCRVMARLQTWLE